MFVSQEIEFRTMFTTIYKMTLILSLKLLIDCELRTWTGIEFHNLGAVYSGLDIGGSSTMADQSFSCRKNPCKRAKLFLFIERNHLL